MSSSKQTVNFPSSQANNIAFCNVSFGERYVRTQERLKQSILDIYPDAQLFFWTDELPPGSKPFQESLYGFKVHAIKHARVQGFTKVVWIDTCAILKGKLEPLFEACFIAVADENALYRYSSKIEVKTKSCRLVGGSLYLFDFDQNYYLDVFESWATMESNGDFGSQEFIMNEKNDGVEKCGHRMDETCMAIAIYGHGGTPESGELYQQVCEKKHFLEPGDSGIKNYLRG